MIIQRQKNDSEGKYVYDKLIEFNAQNMPKNVSTNYEPINLILSDDHGNIQGGVLAYWTWNWMHVDILWVDEKWRGQGYGSKLLDEIERIAVEKCCEVIELDTYNFQAPAFYKKKGYEVCGTIQYAQGQVVRYYLLKRLP